MDPATLKLIAVSTLPTGVVSLIAFLIAWWTSPRRRDAAHAPAQPLSLCRQVVPLLLITLCASALYSLVFQGPWPDFPPQRGRHAVAFVGLAVFVIGLAVIGFQWARLWITLAANALSVLAITTITLLLTLHKQLAADDGWEKWGGVAAAFIVMTTAFTSGLMVLGRRAGLPPALVFFGVAFAVSQVLVLGYHSISECIMAAAVCAVTGGFAAVTLARPHAALGAAGALALGSVLAALLLQGAAFGVSDMPWRLLFAAMLAISPWTALFGNLLAIKLGVKRTWLRGGLLVAGAALPALAALAIAGKMYTQDSASGY